MPPTTPPLRALLYCRVSQLDARQAGRSRSTTEQETELRRWAEREGWQVVAVETDDGLSASRHAKRKHRPAWESVQARIAAGEADVLLTWEASRATRRIEGYAQLRDLCARHGVRWGYGGTLHDLGDAGDRFRTGLDALLSESESDRTSARIRRTTAAAADAGRVHGRLGYGWQRRYDERTGALLGQEPNEDEAPIVREIIERVARGDSIRALTRELNARGVPAPHGADEWNHTGVRRIARNLAYAGLRVHHGRVTLGDWPAIVDESLVRSVIARTDANSHGRRSPSSTAVNLLSGVLRCSICGDRMYAADNGLRAANYWCRRPDFTDEQGKLWPTGHLSIAKASAESFVIDTMTAWLRSPDVARSIAAHAADDASSESAAEAAALQSRLDEAVAAFAAGELSARALGAVEAQLEPRIMAAERAAIARSVPPTVTDAIGGDFAKLDLQAQREVIGAVVELVVLKAKRRSNRFDPERIEWRWRF